MNPRLNFALHSLRCLRFHLTHKPISTHSSNHLYPTSVTRHLCAKSLRPFNDENTAAAEAQALLQSLSQPPDNPSNYPILSKAATLASKAVAEDSPRGKTLLASMHREGLGVKQDVEASLRLFQQAAEAGDPIAQCSLGALMLSSIKKRVGSQSSMADSEIIVEVDDKGEAHARVELQLEDGEAESPAELVRRVRKARRKAGFTDDQAMEFEEHKERERVKELEKEREIAVQWLEAAVEQGNDEAMVLLGNEVLERDAKRAIDLFQLAIQTAKNTDAYFNLGQIYTEGVGVEVDHKKAAMNFAMAAQLGDASAQFYLGHLYRVGSDHVQVDDAAARQYVELAAEQAHPAATYYLALMHLNGEGGLEASDGAFKRYLFAAAKLEHGPAHAYLGEMYYKGSHGVETDYQEALFHFTKAGSLGESEALCSAAAMHFRGLGTEQDHHQAFLIYQQAAEFGSLAALRNIAVMYFQGQGVPANKQIAQRFFDMAEEEEKRRLQEAKEHTSGPVRITDAPKHPMADVPREVVAQGLKDIEAAMEGVKEG